MFAVASRLAIPPLVFALTFAGCGKKPVSTDQPTADQPITLSIWRPASPNDAWPEALSNYLSESGLTDTVKIEYKTLPAATYESTVIEAIANKRGPDIFTIPNDSLHEHGKKLVAAPATVVTADQIKKSYVPVVYNQVVYKNNVYGLPEAMQPLSVIINPALFAAQDIDTELPLSWKGFVRLAKKLTIIKDGKMVQSGLAMGTGSDVLDSPDIISLMMLQNRTTMTTADHGQATFHLPKSNDLKLFPGNQALQYYTDFANAKSSHYTYDPAVIGPAIKAFVQGKVAMLIGYPDLVSYFSQTKSSLETQVKSVPQLWSIDFPTAKDRTPSLSEPVEYVRYNIDVVSEQSANTKFAWQFLAGFDHSALPTGDDGSPFIANSDWFENRLAPQFARAWFVGGQPDKTSQTFRDMADAISKKGQSVSQAINAAAGAETTLLQGTPTR